MEQRPDISIIIVSYQVKEILRDCLLSIRKFADVSYEIVLVDNASTDGTAEMIRNEFPEVRLLAEKVNHGFSPGNNLGMQVAAGTFFLLLNPDTIISKHSLSTWLSQHRKCHAAVSGPRLLNADLSLQVSAWKTPRWTDSLLELLYLHRIFQVSSYPVSQFSGDFTCECLSGAAILFERSWFEKTGGLDEELFWVEDVDFCYRVRKQKGLIRYVHDAAIVHLGGQSSKSNYDRVISNQLVSRLKFVHKHSNFFTFGLLAVILYLHVITRIIAFHLIYPFNRNPKAKAYRYALGKLNRYMFKNDRSI